MKTVNALVFLPLLFFTFLVVAQESNTAQDGVGKTAKVYTGQIIESGVKTGDKVKSINGKSFKDYCELLMYQFLTKEKILTIEMQDGKQFTFKKEKLY